MNSIKVSDANQFHQMVGDYLNLAHEGKLSKDQLRLFRDLIASSPFAVTDLEKERIFTLQGPVDLAHPTIIKMADVFNQIIELISAQTSENLMNPFTISAFMPEVIHFLPENDIVNLANASKNLRYYANNAKVNYINQNSNQSLIELGFENISKLSYFLSYHGKELKSLDLSEFNISNDDLQQIVKACPQLNQLSIQSDRIDNRGISEITNRLPQLIALNINKCKISAAGFRMIDAGLPQLKKLGFKYLDVPKEAARAPVKNLNQLIALSLNCFKSLKAFAANIEGMPRLTALNLLGVEVEDEEIRFIVERFPHLKELYLEGKYISNEGVRAITEGLRDLTILDLTSGRLGSEEFSITSEGIRMIATNLKQLRELNINGNDLTGEDLNLIAAELPELRSLSGNFHLNLRPWTFFAPGKLPHLTKLELRSYQLAHREFEAIVAGMPQLRVFGFHGGSLNSEGLERILNGLPHLRSLCLAGAKINDKDVENLVKKQPQLETLDARGTSISDAGLKVIVKGLPLLRSLNVRGTLITNEGIKEINNGLPLLRNLRFYPGGITDDVLAKMRETHPAIRVNDA